MLFLGIPSASRSVLYIVRKTFLRRSQCRWNRKKRCGIDGDIQEISLTIMNHGGGNEVWSLGITFRKPKRRCMDTSYVARDLDERGTKHSIGILYCRNRVMIRPILVSPISPVSHYGNRPKLVSLESYDHGESNAVGCKDFGLEFAEDVGIYRETIKGA